MGKPIFLASGASKFDEVKAVEIVLENNSQLCVMQCNTNYTGNIDNFRFVNLNVLKQFSKLWPNMVLGFRIIRQDILLF